MNFTKITRITPLLIVVLLVSLIGFVHPVQAATITVDASCTLADAITAANTDAISGACPAGSGADTIVLTINPPALLVALPVVASDITLNGQGFTINGNGLGFPVLEVSASGILTLNNINVTGGGAGGVLSAGSLTVNDSTISGNFRVGNGGGISSSGALSVNRSTISGNSVSGSFPTGGFGGGIFQSAGTHILVNTTISGNFASQRGGGIAYQNAFVTFENVTVAMNEAVASGGGIYSITSSGIITTTFNRTLLSGNFSNNIGNEFHQQNSGGFGNVKRANSNVFGHSGESTAQGFSGMTPSPPSDRNACSDGAVPVALAAIIDTTLNNNGVLPHPDTHALPVGSPAIDFAPSAACSAAPINNQDARTGVRNIDGNSLVIGECDTGAFEYNPNPTVVELSELKASPALNWAPLMLALALGLAALGSLYFLRKRQA
jgi:hypothetical protein